MELKYNVTRFIALDIYTFNRTAYGIEMIYPLSCVERS